MNLSVGFSHRPRHGRLLSTYSESKKQTVLDRAPPKLTHVLVRVRILSKNYPN